MNKTRKRTCVQAKRGEVLTSETCARRLLEEQEKRNAKQNDSKKDSGKSLKKQHENESDEMDDDEETEDNDKNQPGASLDLRPGDHVKVIKGDFAGYYASVEENASNDLFHIQYFKSQFGKYVVNEGDIDIRDKVDLQVVSAEIDGRSRFTFSF